MPKNQQRAAAARMQSGTGKRKSGKAIILWKKKNGKRVPAAGTEKKNIFHTEIDTLRRITPGRKTMSKAAWLRKMRLTTAGKLKRTTRRKKAA